ncbi:hypothetical protein N9344_00175 [bacterium]|nr:hypothetical protein [bacterium]
MKKVEILFILLISSLIAQGSDGTRSLGLGGFGVTLNDVWSIHNNQAGLGFNKNILAAINYENRFLLKETSFKTGAFILPFKNSSIGLSIQSFGYQLYSKNQLGLAYGLRFSDKISGGLKLNYIYTQLSENYGSKNSFTADVGLITKVTEHLTMGVQVVNPTRTSLTEFNNEKLPTIMKLGLDYLFSEKVFVGVEVEKNFNTDAIVKVGLEYRVVENLYLRGGISTNPTLTSMGIGFLFKYFKIDVSTSYHQVLGLTPSVSLIYSKEK